MNADEAKKCYNIAVQALNDKNFDKAEKFCTKSIKLHETEDAQFLLKRIDIQRTMAAKQAHEPSQQ